MKHFSLVRWMFSCVVAGMPPLAALALPNSAPPEVNNLYKRYCVECHGPDNAEAEFDLVPLLLDPDGFPENGVALKNVADIVALEDMPPDDAELPTESERAAMVAWADETLARIAREERNDPGRVVMPRLTQTEYDRVIRDLTGQPISASHLLPAEGGAGEGFSNVGEAQSVSLTQLEKYLASGKFVLRHLVATPAGWTWSRVPLPVAETEKEVAENLAGLIRQWYVDTSKEVGNGDYLLKRKFGNVTAAYLEAAWRHRYRRELGHGDRDPGETAARVSPEIDPIALRKWLAILERDPAELPEIAAVMAEQWRALPGPDESSEKERRKLFSELGDMLESLKRKTWQMKYAPEFEVSYQGEERQDEVHDSSDEGIWPFEIQLDNHRELYLTVTPAGRVGESDTVIWENGRFELDDGAEVEWSEALEDADIEVEFSKQDSDSDSGDRQAFLTASAPSVIRLPVPENAVRFFARARVPEEAREEATVQVMILPKPLTGVDRIIHPERRPLGHTNREPLESWIDEVADSRSLVRDRIDYSKRPAPLGDMVTERVVNKLGLPDRDFGEDAWKPGVYTPEELRAWVGPEERKKLESQYGLLAGLATDAGPLELREIALRQIRPWMRLAWRRPVTDSEAEEIVGLFDAGLAAGDPYDSAVKQALTAVLLSPHFIYRHPEAVPLTSGESTRSLTGLELANRLSFALWASIPDEELIELGISGELEDPEILRQQAERMLADSRATALAEEFAGQWFRFHNFENFREPDNRTFPEFEESIAEAMHQEMLRFFDDLIRNDRSVLRVLDADYTFVNEELAEFYGIPGVEGGVQRVSLEGTPRRGVATMGAVLTKNSSAMRTSPVKRGVYIIEEILGEHLPTPPADIPPLSDGERNEEGQTITEQLAEHRDNASCSGCHSKFDPLGIALENFDGIGRWREVDSAGDPLATTDTLPDGTVLEGVRDLTAYLASQEDRYLEHFNRKLLGYMLGRGVRAGDQELLETMTRNLEQNDHRFSAAIETVLASPQFREMRWFRD